MMVSLGCRCPYWISWSHVKVYDHYTVLFHLFLHLRHTATCEHHYLNLITIMVMVAKTTIELCYHKLE